MRIISRIIGITGIILLALLISLGSANLHPAFGEDLEDKIEKDQKEELKIGQIPPDFTVADLSGDEFTLSEMAGEKPVILDFWATWCGPCVRAIPELIEIHEEYGDDVMVVGIGVWMDETDIDEIHDFVTENDINYRIVHNVGSDLAVAYLVEGIPTLVAIGLDGEIALIKVGFSEDLGDQLVELLDLE